MTRTIIDTNATLRNVVNKGLAKGYVAELDKIGGNFSTHPIFRSCDGQNDFESIYRDILNLQMGDIQLRSDTFLRELIIEYIESKNPEVIERIVY